LPELTAYHEAGHVWSAIHCGAQVLRVTIEPAWDDGPLRYGDTQVVWPVGRMSPREFQRKSVLVALAGPVAEMIHVGRSIDVDGVAEWTADWQAAWDAAAQLAPAPPTRMRMLERCTAELIQLLGDNHHWDALARIVDHLLAHETLDQEMIEEIFANG